MDVLGEQVYLSVNEMMKYLRVGKTTAYALLHRDGFPAVKLTNGKYIVPVKELDAWVHAQIGNGRIGKKGDDE